MDSYFNNFLKYTQFLYKERTSLLNKNIREAVLKEGNRRILKNR